MGIKTILTTSLILIFCGASQAAQYKTYYNDEIPARRTVHIERVGDNYYSSTGNTYRKDGNYFYGSNGSAYEYGTNRNTIQELSTGKTYQKDDNLYHPLY